MTLELMNTSADKRYLSKSTSVIKKVTCKIKEETSIINPTVICSNTVVLWYRGWQKLIAWTGNAAEPIADLSTHQLKNSISPQSSKSN